MPKGKVAQAVFELAGKRPSEAGLEVNVLRHLANCLEKKRRPDEGAVTITVPTQPEENKLGFDAATDLAPGLYVALQFKRPHDPENGAASFCLQTDQLCTLIRRYPPKSAFYVLPAVESNSEMWDAGDGLLGRACLVDAWDLLLPALPAKVAACALGARPIGALDLQRLLGVLDPDVNPLGKKSLTVQVDRRGPCTASVSRPGGRLVGVAARPAKHLCCRRRPAWAGFAVVGGGDGKIRTREGGGWGRSECTAEAQRRLRQGAPAPADPHGTERGARDGQAEERRGMLARSILDYAERGGGRGRRSCLARIGGAPPARAGASSHAGRK